ncbi:MAG TPA: NUDIX hydrolase [Chloroflexota bacterium]|nr:NUDIX hydrolase [Chloroflexota bacterium]
MSRGFRGESKVVQPYTAQVAERTIASRQVYQGRLINLRVDEVELDNGHRSTREIVEHPGAVAIVAFTEDRKLVLVRQYRKAADLLTLEIPAGTLGAGEEPLACARRELKEETGFTAHTFDRICSFYTAVGFCTELLHLFAAGGLEAGDQAYEDDESIEVVTMPVSEAMEAVRSGEIVDAKSVAGVFWAQLYEARDPRALALAGARP